MQEKAVDENKTQRVAVIMAGGAGERFWPLSRKEHPKQLLRLTSETETMLHEAVARSAPLIPPAHIYVQTMGHLMHPIREAAVGVAPENVIAEPCKRNTAGCLIYAAAHMIAKYGEDVEISMAVLTADHVIGDADAFRATVDAALRTAEREEVLVTIGVPPTRPATGYGYIQAGAEQRDTGALPVQAFHEKPSLERAQEYLDAGNYYWNSGMFFWRVSTFLKELDAANPEMAEKARAIAMAMRAGDTERAQRTFEALENISIDYALMEKSRHVTMVPAPFPWDDVGTWAALERTREPDSSGNVTQGGPVLVNCRDSIVYNAEGVERMAVSVVGMDGVVVVVTADAVLVVSKDHTEDVKKAVQELEKRGSSQL